MSPIGSPGIFAGDLRHIGEAENRGIEQSFRLVVTTAGSQRQSAAGVSLDALGKAFSYLLPALDGGGPSLSPLCHSREFDGRVRDIRQPLHASAEQCFCFLVAVQVEEVESSHRVADQLAGEALPQLLPAGDRGR
jgi:hypothetical protein